MTALARTITDTDVALLRTLAREHSVVAASRSIGISRDRAVYRLARLGVAFGGPVVTSVRGGTHHGGTRLTALGDRIVRRGFDSVELFDARPLAPRAPSNHVRGVYHRLPEPQVDLGRGVRLRVAFAAGEGEPVTVVLDPESILIARANFPSSARNVLRATVEGVHPGVGPAGSSLVARVGAFRVHVAVTAESVRAMHLSKGARVWLYVKATALRVVGRTTARPARVSRR